MPDQWSITYCSLGRLVQFMNAAIAAEGIEKRVSDTEHHFVSMLYGMHSAAPQKFTEDDIRFHVVPSIGGGSDTTAATIGAVIYYLIKSPSVLHKLRQELDDKRENREMSWPVKLREAQGCVYLQAVIKETMRLYPGNGLPLPRIIPEEGLTLAGRHFPAGVCCAPPPSMAAAVSLSFPLSLLASESPPLSEFHRHFQIKDIRYWHIASQTIVGTNAWVANFNKDVFGADAMVFRPERWLDSSPAQIVDMDNYFLTVGSYILPFSVPSIIIQPSSHPPL